LAVKGLKKLGLDVHRSRDQSEYTQTRKMAADKRFEILLNQKNIYTGYLEKNTPFN